ncbi:CGG triplet repeat-binding protein 1 [Caligus rogercresseyi]|uniref:CGG triplet repeat-binding protein 1 n=1 Tax=Caligus rogercresseyi TaxID=217165 RepID=A0A7T8K8B1_CALRO|nr:CGG triplet repeat-binding protein 1 [Caligus rogercresseyi]
MNSVLEKNPDFEKIKLYSGILKRETLELKDDPKLPFLFSCAPITSVDCERVFTKLKFFLSNQRISLTENHVKDMLILQWNNDYMT